MITENKEKEYYIGFKNDIVYIESDIQGIAVYRRTFSNVKDAIESVFINNKEDVTERAFELWIDSMTGGSND